MPPILELRGLRVRYGAIEAVKGISLTVGHAEIVTLIGGNGAGKTTTLKAISSVLRPAAGEILFEGERTDRLPSHEVVRRGICQAPEGRRIFPRMSVKDNLEMGAYIPSAKAERTLRGMEDLSKHRYVSPATRATVYLGLGEKEKALDWLEKGFEDRDPSLWWITGDQLYDSVRVEPRFKALLQKVDALKEATKQ